MIPSDSKTISCVLFAFALTGCVTVSPDNAASLSQRDLCQIASGNGFVANSEKARADARAELTRRNLFSYKDFMGVQSGYVQIGMSEAAAVCALGGYPADVNTTTTRYGHSKQYVFGDYRMGNVSYLYTENGKVTAYQD